jgi:isopropylmalate/homocitrate/citramalate synthase
MAVPWYSPGRFHVGPANFEAEVVDGFELPPGRRAYVVDSTIRKLECTPGVRLSSSDKVALALRAEAIGVSQIFINNVHFVEEYFESTAEIAARKRDLVLTVQTWLTDDWRHGVARAIETGADQAEVEARTSEVELARLGLDRDGMSQRLRDSLAFGADRGARMVAGFMDSTRADLGYLLDLVSVSLECGAKQLTFYDSFGALSPDAVRFFVRRIRDRIGPEVPLVIHLHDSFGVATAGAAAAITAGATHVDTAAYGFPSNIPLAPLEETVLLLELLYGVSTGIKLDQICDYCRMVEQVSGVPIAPNKPVVGSHIFLFESDNEVAEHFRQTEVENLKPYAAELVGRKATVVWDINTLRGDAVRAKLESMRLSSSPEIVTEAVQRIRARLDETRAFPVWVTESDVESICRQAALTAARPVSKET